MSRRVPLLALCLTLFLVQATAQQSSREALDLLNRVADHYKQAKSVHLEARLTRTSHSDLSTYSSTSFLKVWASDGKRFRYDGRTRSGSALLVSDGTHEWHLRRSFDQYDEADSGSYFRQPSVYSGDDEALVDARSLVTEIEGMRGKIDLARFAPSEDLEFNGRKIRCTVVQFEYAQNVDRDPQQSIAWRNTIWFTPGSLTVLKIERRNRYQMMQGMLTPPHGVWMDNVDQTVFTAIDLEAKPTPDIFVFTPPPSTVEVAKLPSLIPTLEGKKVADTLAADHYIGKPLPAVVLHDADGADVSLSRFHGHPMLIDVWATWCGPCMHDMPALGKLRASTATTDLQFVGIDEDSKTADATAYLKKHEYNWPDFHLTETAEKQLSIVGIPVMLLVDATGNVVYYHVGEGNAEELVAAVRKLGPAYANASAE